MKPKFILAEVDRQILAECLAQIEARQKAIVQAEAELDRLTRAVPQLGFEIEFDEQKLDVTDSAAFASLETKKRQLIAIQSDAIPRVEYVVEQLRNRLGDDVNAAGRAIGSALADYYRNCEWHIAKLLLPFSGKEEAAQRLAAQTDHQQALHNFTSNRGHAEPVGQTIAELKLALSGECPFKFQGLSS